MTKTLTKIKQYYVNKQFLFFFVSGTTAFLADLTTLSVLIYVIKFNPEIKLIDLPNLKLSLFFANVISVAVGIVVGYCLNRYWAFNSRSEKVASQMSRYIGVAIFNLFLNNAIYGFLVPLGVLPPLAKTIATGLQMFWTFVLYRVIVFRV